MSNLELPAIGNSSPGQAIFQQMDLFAGTGGDLFLKCGYLLIYLPRFSCAWFSATPVFHPAISPGLPDVSNFACHRNLMAIEDMLKDVFMAGLMVMAASKPEDRLPELPGET